MLTPEEKQKKIEELFRDENAASPRPPANDWAKLTAVGNMLVGTLVGVYERFNALSEENNPQTIYAIKDLDGKTWNFGSKPAIDKQIFKLKVRLGQIIGFKFVALGKPRPGRNPAHIITVFTNKDNEENKFDKEWLTEHPYVSTEPVVPCRFEEETEETEISSVSTPPSVEPKPAEDVPFVTTAEKIVTISDIAKRILNVSTPEEIKNKVAEVTGLAFTTPNLDAILNRLKELETLTKPN